MHDKCVCVFQKRRKKERKKEMGQTGKSGFMKAEKCVTARF